MKNCTSVISEKEFVLKNIAFYGSIILLIFGTFGNLVVIATFCKKRTRQPHIAPYLFFLLLVDLLTIWVNYMRIIWSTWPHGNKNGIYKNIPYGYFIFIMSTYSVWITVIISIERLLAVCCPFSRRLTPKIYIPYLVLLITLAGVCIAIALMAFLNGQNNTFLPQLTLYSFLPSVIISITSIAMIYKLLQRPNLGQRLRHNPSKQSKSTIYLVITINIAFLLTTFPVSVYSSLISYDNCDTENIFQILDMLATVNNCLNFILYFVASRIFRQNMKKVCCEENPRNRNKYVYTIQYRRKT